MNNRNIWRYLKVGLLLLTGWLLYKPVQAQAVERIHFINTGYPEDAIVLESNGRFGIIDSAEDSDYPDGSDSRYPLRDGTTLRQGSEDEVLSYLRSLGINANNLEFYLGTHAHSDHIGSADSVIREFRPARVYLKPYADQYVSVPEYLWDNLYIYNQMLEAVRETGAVLIQHFDAAAPILPEHSEWRWSEIEEQRRLARTANPVFMLGNMKITLLNTEEAYVYEPVYDINVTGLCTKVEVNGHSAFLAADIENRIALTDDPDEVHAVEDKLVPFIGKVDVLKLGHHGLYGSNSGRFLTTLHPAYAILTGKGHGLYERTMQRLFESGTIVYSTIEGRKAGFSSTIVNMDNALSMTGFSIPLVGRLDRSAKPIARIGNDLAQAEGWYQNDGKWYYFERTAQPVTGWKQLNGSWYYLEPDSAAMTEGWKWLNGSWYYLEPGSGEMAKGWKWLNDSWYYLEPGSGAMAKGWKQLNGSWYYLEPGSGAMVKGWKQLNGSWYYLEPGSGAMVEGWKWLNGSWYYLELSSGAMAKGWKQLNGSWYYLEPGSGAMAKGWKQLNGSWYYLEPGSGAMAKGWKRLNGSWYYLEPGSGAMVTGWKRLAGRWYYLRPENGVMAVGTITINHIKYHFSASGVWLS